MSGTTGDLAELSLQVNYETVSRASGELQTFQGRASQASRETDSFNTSQTRLDQSLQGLTRTMGLQSQQLALLLPQYQGYVRYAEEMQRATLQLTLEQTRYVTALRDVEPVLRNIGLFSREFGTEVVQNYERLQQLSRQLGTTATAYREVADASRLMTTNLAEQRNIQQQFIQAFTGQGQNGAQSRQRLEDYIGPLGDQTASEAMSRFTERLRGVRDVATQTRDAMAVLGTTSMETVRNLERLASVDIGTQARINLSMQNTMLENQGRYQTELTRLNTAATADRPSWWVGQMAAWATPDPIGMVQRNAPNSAMAGALRGAQDWINTPSPDLGLQIANGANNLEFQTNRRVAEFNSFLQRNLGWSMIGRGAIEAANFGPFGIPTVVSTAAMIPGAYDWLTGRETPGPARPTFNAINNASVQSLAGLGGMVSQFNPQIAAQLSLLQSTQQLQQMNQASGGAYEEAVLLSGIGPDGNPVGRSLRAPGGAQSGLQGMQQRVRADMRRMLQENGGEFIRNTATSQELRAGQAMREAQDFMGGSSQRTIQDLRDMAEAAIQGADAVALLNARLSDRNVSQAYRGTSGEILPAMAEVARAATDAARAVQFGTQINGFLGTGASSNRQLQVAQTAAERGGWLNPLSQQQALLQYERDDALALVPAAYTDPAEQERRRLQISAAYNLRQQNLSTMFNLQQRDQVSQRMAQTEIAGYGQGLIGMDASRFGITQQIMGINPAYFQNNGVFDMGAFRQVAGGNTSGLPPQMQELFRAMQQNAQTGLDSRLALGGADFMSSSFGGIVQGAAAGGGPAALRAAQANSGSIMELLQQASERHSVPLQLLRAIAMQESRLGTDPNAMANGGGVMQFIQSTWAEQTGLPSSERLNPAANINAAAQYIRRFSGPGTALGGQGGLNLSDPSSWDRVLQRFNGGGDPNYVRNVRRYLDVDPAQFARTQEQSFVAGQVGGAQYQAQAANMVSREMQDWMRGGGRSGTFESNMQGFQQAASQGVTDPTAIQALVTAANDAAAAMARLNLQRETFNSNQEMDGYRRFNEVMRETGGNIDVARAAMERFVAARRAGIPEQDVATARGIQAITGIGRLGVDEAQRGQTLGQQQQIAALEYGSFGMPDRDRQVMIQVAQADMAFNNQVQRLRANVDNNDPQQVAQFDTALQTAQETYNVNRATIADTARLRGALQDAQRAQELLLEPMRGALRNMQTEAANFWRVMLEGGNSTAKDLEKSFGDILKNAAAQILGSVSTNLVAGTALNVLGLGSFGNQLGIPSMGGSFGGSIGGNTLSGGMLAGGLSAGSFGGGTGGSSMGSGIMSTLFGSGGGTATQAGTYTPNGFQRGGYMSGLGQLLPFMPLIANETGMSQLSGLGAMMGVNQLMNLNTGGQGLLSWGGLSTAGDNLMGQSTWLDRLAPSLFSNGANVMTASSLGSFGSAASGIAGANPMGFGGMAGVDFASLGAGSAELAGSMGGTAGALGMTGAQALAGVGAIAGVANFAMNPGYGSGISAAGGLMSAAAAYGLIGSAFGPIGMAVGVIGALVSTYFEAGKKRGYAGATGQITTQGGQLAAVDVTGKGVPVGDFARQLEEMTENVNKANAELSLTISEDFGNAYVGIGDGTKDAKARGRIFDTNDPYLSIASAGFLERKGDDRLTAILQGRSKGSNINMSSVDTFANAIRYYDDYYVDAINTTVAPTGLVKQQQDLRNSYFTGKNQANFYGFDMEQIDIGYRTRFNEDTRRGLKAATDPMGAQLEDFDKLALERLETAKAIGADINQVERLNGEERKKIVEQYMGGITNAFRSALKALTQGNIAGETDLSKYNASLTAYSSLLQKYPGAGAEDQGRFIEQAMALVENARSLFSDTPEFAQVYQRVLADLLKLAPEGSDEGSAAAAALKRLQDGYGGNIKDLTTLPDNMGKPAGVYDPITAPTLDDIVANSPIGKDIAAGLAPGLMSLGELINGTNAILREIRDEQRATNNYIKAVITQ